MKVFTYIWQHKFLTLLVALFLCCQGFFIMLLPYISRDIINVGIQQKGVEHVSCDYIAGDHFDIVSQYCIYDDTDLGILIDYYELDDTSSYCRYKLVQVDSSTREKLDDILLIPLIFVNSGYDFQLLSPDDIKKIYEKFLSSYNYENIEKKGINAAVLELEYACVDIGAVSVSYVVNKGGFMLFVALLLACAVVAQNFCSNIIGQRIARDKRKEYFTAIIDFDGDVLNRFSESSLITRATSDIQLVQNMTMIIMQSCLYAPIVVVVGFYFTIQTAPSLLWIIVTAVVAVCVAAFIFLKITVPYFSRMQQMIDKVNLLTRETLSGIYVTRAFNRQKYEQNRFKSANKSLYKLQLFTGRFSAVITPLLTLGYNGISVLILLAGSVYINSGDLQVGDLIAFTTYSMTVVGAFVNIGLFIGSLPRVSVAVNRIEEVIKAGKIHIENEKANISNSLQIDSLLKKQIKFEDVSFSYNNTKTFAVQNMNFSIEPNETLGVIGTVGSGKTTLVKLLMRLNKPSSGKITIGNKDISTINKSSYMKLFSYAPQQSFLFSETICHNVLYGVAEKQPIEDKENYVIKYLDAAQADNFCTKDEGGIYKKISQGATNMSGGQRQRISIARALAANSNILIMDDCTTALDFKTERKLWKEIDSMYSKKTKIIISSRINSVQGADKILVLDNGKIAGIGKHAELLRSCPEYIQIAKAQLKI